MLTISGIWSNIKSFLAILIVGLVIGIVGTSYVCYKMWNKKPATPAEEITVTPVDIHGKPLDPNDPNLHKIYHKDWDFKGEDISFITHAEGEGTIKTIIPKTYIPEYNYWNNKNNIIQGSYYYAYNNGKLMSLYGVSYYRRYHCVALGGGLVGGRQFIGIQISGQIMF